MDYQITKKCILCDALVMLNDASFALCVCMKCYNHRCVGCDKISKNGVCEMCVKLCDENNLKCLIHYCMNPGYARFHGDVYCRGHSTNFTIKCKHDILTDSCYRCTSTDYCEFYCIQCNCCLDLRKHIVAIYISCKILKLPRFIANKIVNELIRGDFVKNYNLRVF